MTTGLMDALKSQNALSPKTITGKIPDLDRSFVEVQKVTKFVLLTGRIYC
jgi:hypothetical protein